SRFSVIGLLQRGSDARVEVAGATIGAIGNGLLVFVGVERGDNEAIADRLLDRLLGYRVFADARGQMNLTLRDVRGAAMQVTLTNNGPVTFWLQVPPGGTRGENNAGYGLLSG